MTATAFVESGLGHISGERGMTTLSEGESRRSRLAALLRDTSKGLALLLDEPARGLHEEDIGRLNGALTKLKHRHTLIINEHKASLAKVADKVLELGPCAGKEGGHIVYTGSSKLSALRRSQLNSVRLHLPVNSKSERLTISGANVNTFSGVNFSIPLGKLVCVTGVSGSGKSSLVRGIIVPALSGLLPGRCDSEGFSWTGGSWKSVEGHSRISSVLAVELRSPSRQRRSTVATLLGLAGDIRKTFGRSADARRLDLGPSDFGWNAGNGRCLGCMGLGETEDSGGWAPCSQCGGRRFGEIALSVLVKGLNVADILSQPLSELEGHPFARDAGWSTLLQQVNSLDLGYLTLGRQVNQISGGEYQRLRIAKALAGLRDDGLLLILDEPSAGLHPKDVRRLLNALDRIVSNGANSVLLVEHNLDLIGASDWIVDCGPGGGPEGGEIVGEGPPKAIAQLNTPTGLALAANYAPSSVFGNDPLLESSKSENVAPQTSVRGARHWLRRLIGDEVTVDELDPVDFSELAVPSESNVGACRPLEIGGLDTEIGRMLLDQATDSNECISRLARIWSDNTRAQLRVNPLLEEMRFWGVRIPFSAAKAAERRINQLRLEFASERDMSVHPRDVRATGERFIIKEGTLNERMQHLRDALVVGGGFVELVSDQQMVLGTIRTRHVDLGSSTPAVAPLIMRSKSLSRLQFAGCCPCCTGSGTVEALDEALFVSDPQLSPLGEGFLNTEALAVLRWTRRNVQVPFFRRMESEGLWLQGQSFQQLGLHDRMTLLHGFWCRPGHGSFLKARSKNPKEVNSWLRWDGLISALRAESKRSKNPQWRSQIDASATTVECPLCLGTGLQNHARAVNLGKRSYFDWIQLGTVEEFANALEDLKLPSRRSEHMKKRVLHCIGPMTKAIPQARLRDAVHDQNLAHTVFGRVVHSMTGLTVLDQ
ncbi:MAG: ATP-binding cassette domain-containing protein [Rhodobacteraceae bacterium]|nr:ATP-binding cassette domain-containing protein [Paracoccaceae bacterium]